MSVTWADTLCAGSRAVFSRDLAASTAEFALAADAINPVTAASAAGTASDSPEQSLAACAGGLTDIPKIIVMVKIELIFFINFLIFILVDYWLKYNYVTPFLQIMFFADLRVADI